MMIAHALDCYNDLYLWISVAEVNYVVYRYFYVYVCA